MLDSYLFDLIICFLWVATVTSSPSGTPELTFAGVHFPDTPSIHATLEFIKQYLDEPTLSHVIRSSVFALLTRSKALAQDPSSPIATTDAEIVTVSGLLHDMTWNVTWEPTRQFITQDKRFEVDGADVARKFLSDLGNSSSEAQGWDENRLQLVWDSIALHATASIGQYKQPEVALIGYGIALDVFSNTSMPFPGIPDEYRVTQAEYDQVYAAIPAPDFTVYLKNIGCWLCLEKPQTTYDNFISSYGVQWVDGYTLEGHTVADILIARAEREGIQNYTDKISPSIPVQD